jgi:hypothetical protein
MLPSGIFTTLKNWALDPVIRQQMHRRWLGSIGGRLIRGGGEGRKSGGFRAITYPKTLLSHILQGFLQVLPLGILAFLLPLPRMARLEQSVLVRPHSHIWRYL